MEHMMVLVISTVMNSKSQVGIGYYVYRKKDDKSERVDVKTGVKTKTAVEITEGLEEGEEIYVKP